MEFLENIFSRNFHSQDIAPKNNATECKNTAWKGSKYGVISGHYLFSCIRTEYGPEITLYLETFYAVKGIHNMTWLIYKTYARVESHKKLSSWMVSWTNVIVPAGDYNRNTRTRCEICSTLIIKTPERRHWPYFWTYFTPCFNVLLLTLSR